MQPQSDHETAIAKDAKLLEDPDTPFEDIIMAVLGSLGFALSKSDSLFLVDYAKRCRKT